MTKRKGHSAESQLGLHLPATRTQVTYRPGQGRRARSPRRMKHAGLFAGIGGIERGLEQAGHPTVLLCEVDEAACAVLEHHFPEARMHRDVRTLDSLPRGVELLSAGFPCQDLSQAGRTAGIRGPQSGLVGHVFRLLDRRPVPWVLIENVPFMLQLDQGHALDVLLDALEERGYMWAYRVVDTLAFGLPQRRQRVFLLASRKEDPRHVLFADDAGPPPDDRANGDTANGFYWTEGIRGLGWAVDAIPTLKGGSTVGVPSPPAIVRPDGIVGKPSLRDAERLQGFPSHWTKPAEREVKRNFRWKLIGNAVSVPVARWIGRRLAQPGDFELDGVRRINVGQKWPRVSWNVGEGRFTANISSWPKRHKRRHLQDFLLDELEPLSLKATSGFFERTKKSSLRFPEGFLQTVERHLKRMEAESS